MSKTFEGVVSDLREVGSLKMKEINVLFDGHQKWLKETVNDLKRRIDALGPPDKRHRVCNDVSKVHLHVNNQQV